MESIPIFAIIVDFGLKKPAIKIQVVNKRDTMGLKFKMSFNSKIRITVLMMLRFIVCCCHDIIGLMPPNYSQRNPWRCKIFQYSRKTLEHELIEAEGRIYASVNWTIIGSDNSLIGLKGLS